MPAPAHDSRPAPYSWRYIFDVALEHKPALILAHIVAVFTVAVNIPIPLLMPLLVDEVLLNKPGTLVNAMNAMFPAAWHGPFLYIGTILLVTVLLRVAGIALGVWQSREFTLIAKDVTFRMRRAMLGRLQQISMAEYETLGSGAVASRFVTDINAVDEFVGASLSKLLIASLSLVGISAVLIWMHWPIAVFILLMNPIVIYFTVVLGKKVKQLKKEENSAFEVFQHALVETLDGIRQIRASNRERHYLQRVMDKAMGIRTHSAAFSWKSDAANRFSFGVFLIGFDTFRAISMLMVVFSDLTVGQMMAVFGYLWFMMNPVQELLGIQYAFYGAKAALGRINSMMGLRQELHYPHNKNPFKGRHSVAVSVKNIVFSYGDNEPVLKGVSLDIAAGEKVALVGASGGGKSTLVQVILGMYPPQSGTVCFDGVPVTEIGLDVVRSNVATVLQHPAMFNDTVRNNITLGQECSDDQLWNALEIAQLKDIVCNMPDKLDTVIGQQGVRLSGGQQQRLAIARMTVMDPKVVILDEATSALDTETETRLHVALDNFLHNRTTLIIAHRLSAVKKAQRVYVFEDGHIIEQGEHDELLENEGLYARLYGALQS